MPEYHRKEQFKFSINSALNLFTAIYILFADEMFRWDLAFRIRNVEQAEPSECEIAGRYIAWVVLPIIALFLFVMGLQYVS